MHDCVKQFNEAKYGMFIHWGPFIKEHFGEQESLNPDGRFYALTMKNADSFDAKHYNPQQWVEIAKQGGMKYIVLTATHIGEYLLWDSKVSDFNAVKGKPGRDLLKEFCDACRNEGLRIGFYYATSLLHICFYEKGIPYPPEGDRITDHPELFKKLHDINKQRLRELLSNYGRVHSLWLDSFSSTYHPIGYETGADGYIKPVNELKELCEMIRELQPEIMLCDGEPSRGPNQKGYFYTDSAIRSICTAPNTTNENSFTIYNNLNWGYHQNCRVRTPKEIIFTLIDCATKQSNFLLNASPRLDGSFPEDQRKVILEAGEWIRNNGEAIYGVNAQSPRNMITSSSGRFALKNKKIYFYVYRWPTDGNICMGGLNRKINRIFLLSSGQKLSFKQNENRATINSLPERDPDKYCSVIVME